MANERSLTTRDRLLNAALDRFSRDGWGGTSIRDLAGDVGIRESSVYKHFSSKQALFDALLDLADQRVAEVADRLGVSVASGAEAAPGYRDVSEDRLLGIAEGFFDAMLHDADLSRLRRLFVVNQYRDAEIGERLRAFWMLAPLRFHREVFADLLAKGAFRDGLDADGMALAFFGPISLLLQLAEPGGEREEEAREMLVTHVRHFRFTHLRNLAGASVSG